MNEKLKKLLPWIIFSLIVIGLGVWIFLSKQITEEELAAYDTKIAEAELQYESMEYSTAMSAYYDATEILPQKIEAYKGIVKILLEKNRIEDAVEIVEKSASKVSASDQSILYNMLGEYYYENENYTLSYDMYNQSLGIGYTNATGELGLSKSAVQTENLDTAKASLAKNIYEGDEKSEAKLLLAYVYSIEDVDRAREILNENTPTDSWKVYFEEFENVLNSLSDDTKFNAAKLGRVFINNGYPFLAISLLNPLETEMSEYIDGLYFLGRAYYDHQNYDRAIEVLDQASLIGGFETEIFWTEARAYNQRNDTDKTVEMYDRAISYAGESVSSDLAEEYITFLLEKSRLYKADEVVKKIVNYTDEAWGLLLALEVYKTSEDTEKADYYLAELEEMDLDAAQEKIYLYYKTLVYIESDSLTLATTQLSDLQNLDKYNPYYYYLLGYIEYLNDNTENAINALEKCIEYDMNYEITEEASKLLSRIE